MFGPTSLKIGDVVLTLVPDSASCEFSVEDAYTTFVADDPPDVTLRVHCGYLPDLELGEKVFDSGGIWSLYREQRKWSIGLRSPVLDTGHYRRLAVFEDDFCTGDVYIKSNEPRHRPFHFPLEHPLGQVLMVHLLSRGRGVLVHSCALSHRGRGYLFAGDSGAGKSTLATLWKGQKATTLLNDDRVIVREKEGRFWAYGTPWPGEVGVTSPDGVPLERIFVIRHAAENRAVPLAPPNAVSRLLSHSFSTFWDTQGMAFTLEFLDKLSRAVPCYELGFVPDESVVDFLRCIP